MLFDHGAHRIDHASEPTLGVKNPIFEVEVGHQVKHAGGNILAALRDGDADRAMETMKKHITIVGVRFNDLVSSFNRIMGDE